MINTKGKEFLKTQNQKLFLYLLVKKYQNRVNPIDTHARFIYNSLIQEVKGHG